MATLNDLTSEDYKALAQVMAGPHGQTLTSDAPADLLIVFSCADPEVGRSAARLHADKLVRYVIFAGGVGKDSAGLATLGITEAIFLASVAIAEGLPTDSVGLEQESGNGAENAAMSLRLAYRLGLLPQGTRVAGLAPAPRSRRLYEELRYQADAGPFAVDVVAGLPSGAADSEAPEIQDELVRELRGLRTMHEGNSPRIHMQADFQAGGPYQDLAERVGFPA
jgi:hypothetical protein